MGKSVAHLHSPFTMLPGPELPSASLTAKRRDLPLLSIMSTESAAHLHSQSTLLPGLELPSASLTAKRRDLPLLSIMSTESAVHLHSQPTLLPGLVQTSLLTTANKKGSTKLKSCTVIFYHPPLKDCDVVYGRPLSHTSPVQLLYYI